MTLQPMNDSENTEKKISCCLAQDDPQQDRSASCVILPVTPGLAETEVLYRRGEQGGPELVIPLERPLNLETLQQLASHKYPAALLEEVFDQERRAQENLTILARKAQDAAQA